MGMQPGAGQGWGIMGSLEQGIMGSLELVLFVVSVFVIAGCILMGLRGIRGPAVAVALSGLHGCQCQGVPRPLAASSVRDSLQGTR